MSSTPPQSPPDEQPMQLDLAPFARLIDSIAGQLAQWFQERLPQILGLYDKVTEAAWAGYREAGMPYGETFDGLLLWLRDMHEVREHIAAAEAILRKHRDLRLSRLAGDKPTDPLPVVRPAQQRKK